MQGRKYRLRVREPPGIFDFNTVIRSHVSPFGNFSFTMCHCDCGRMVWTGQRSSVRSAVSFDFSFSCILVDRDGTNIWLRSVLVCARGKSRLRACSQRLAAANLVYGGLSRDRFASDPVSLTARQRKRTGTDGL
jgi:hypothetical protein